MMTRGFAFLGRAGGLTGFGWDAGGDSGVAWGLIAALRESRLVVAASPALRPAAARSPLMRQVLRMNGAPEICLNERMLSGSASQTDPFGPLFGLPNQPANQSKFAMKQ
jgi:hypothetical protein